MAQDYQSNFLKAFLQLLKVLKLDKKDISSIYFFAILNGLIALILPLGIQTIISFVMAGSISASIVVLIFIVVLGVFCNGLVQVRQMQIIEKVEQKIFTRYTLEIADKLPKLDIEKLDGIYLPELVNRFFDVPSLAKRIDKLLLDLPSAIIQILFGLVLLMFYHPIFIGFGAFLITIVVVLLTLTSRKGLATSIAASNYKYAIAAWLEEMSRVIKSFKFGKKTDLHIQKTDELIGNYLESRTSHFKVLLTQFWSLITFKIIITAAMLTVGAILLVNQQINVGQFIAVDIVILAIISSVEKLISNLDKIYDALTSIQKISKLVDSESEINGSLNLNPIDKGVSIKLNDVSFQYPNGDFTLNHISLDIKPGQLVCIDGASGSGKSSLLRLLTGEYHNYEGSILIDDVPISNYNLTSLRSLTGILLNQQDIFNGTLYENLTMGNPDHKVEDVSLISHQLGLTDFIQSHHKGYDAILDPFGKRLSSNIKQEILLVRALLGKHRLLLLEDPFDHLDDKEKSTVLHYLKNNTVATTIIISSDKVAQAACDVIVNLKDGRIIN
ncbi:MAG: ABC transporter ATP-binding protein [Chitinophagaceae bacterium]|nr:ABC transporter ATP-binding protein [Chitinophagaceae bacterium]